tara:strand:+ start:233 stop:808 length:576 start_codon:yes stop_codon:yes gene_type:complete
MIRIAVVGDIGCGKSHIAKLFGLPVFNADKEVGKLYKKSKRCYSKLKKALPKYEISFPINKNTLTKAILKNNYNIRKIVGIVHPEIRIKMNEFIKKNKSKKAIVLDIPLLMENKINKKNDILVFVEANKTEILKRLKRRVNFNKKVYKKFKKLQLSLEMKKKKSSFLIKNNFNNQLAKKNVKIVLDKILYD